MTFISSPIAASISSSGAARPEPSNGPSSRLDGSGDLSSKATWHLNLRWTVGDMDRLTFMRANKHMTFGEVLAKLKGTRLECEIARLREIADHFGVHLKPFHSGAKA